MTAPAGNQNALKFDTPEKRKLLCDAYCRHVEIEGLSDECFPECDRTTLKTYIRNFPLDFDTERIERARRKRQLFWERMGRDGANGQIEGFNAKSWTFNMGNRFGWAEKREDTLKVKKDSAALLTKRLFDEEGDEAQTSGDAAEDSPDSVDPEPETVSPAGEPEGVQKDQ